MPLPKLKDRIIHYGQQGTHDWHELRVGKFTSSQIWLLMQGSKSSKSEFSQRGLNYIKSKAVEVLYGTYAESSAGIAGQWGKDYEPIAAEYFEQTYLAPRLLFRDMDQVRFIEHESLPTGTSPDDHVDGRPSEYKCPYNRSIHFSHCQLQSLDDLMKFDKQKAWQIIHQMWLMRSDSAYWVSFDPRLLSSERYTHKALHVIEVEQMDGAVEQLKQKIVAAQQVMNEFIDQFSNQPAA